MIARMKLVLLAFCLTMVGCASTTYNISSQKGINNYFLKDVKVNLSLGNGALEGDETFASQEVLNKQFRDALKEKLNTNSILSTSVQSDTASLVITIDFLRRFNYGGNALNKPHISHKIAIYKGDENIHNLNRGTYTTKYGYLKNLAVDLEIAAFQWGAEDEPLDIDLISQMIVDDLVKALGK